MVQYKNQVEKQYFEIEKLKVTLPLKYLRLKFLLGTK